MVFLIFFIQVWGSWEIVASEKVSTGWLSYFYNRSCFGNNCYDPLCLNGIENYTIFCENYPCKDSAEAVTVTESGMYTFNIVGKQVSFYIEVDENALAWIYIQRRFDGSVNFFRDWNSYKNGFGDVANEFWIGNDLIHELTKGGNAMIRFDLFDGEEWRYAEYDHFQVSNEEDFYRLSVGRYSGTAGDSFSYHSTAKFSTFDSDNDAGGGNCAVSNNGAWWYRDCQNSNLNGMYLNGTSEMYGKGVAWYAFRAQFFSLPQTVMKIRLI